MNIALSCEINRNFINNPDKKEDKPLNSLPLQRAKLINAQTQKEQNQILWELCKEYGLLSNMSKDEREALKPIISRFK